MAKATMNRRSKVGASRNRKPVSNRVAAVRKGIKSPAGFSERKSIADLATEQGVRLEGQLERITGAAVNLWASDKEFGEFVRGINARRKEGLSLGKL
jgi:hypothetical protein